MSSREHTQRRLSSAMMGRYKGCGHSEEGSSGVREGFPEEARFRSGWKDELMFTRWRKDVRSFSHSFYTHFLRPPLGGSAGGPEKSLTPSGPQGAP